MVPTGCALQRPVYHATASKRHILRKTTDALRLNCFYSFVIIPKLGRVISKGSRCGANRDMSKYALILSLLGL